jgi:nucleotide-binding universal stress UspA family protein
MATYEVTRPGPAAAPGPRLAVVAALGDDDSDAAVAAMALQVARTWPGGELHLAHVVDVLPIAQAAAAAPPNDWSHPALGELRRQGELYLGRVGRAVGEALGRPATCHLLAGPPASEIIKLVHEVRASLLVVGTREAGLLSRLLVGSTAEALLRKAPCSVLLARAPHYPAEAARDEGGACPDCLLAEAASCGATRRCDRHALAYGRTHGAPGAEGRPAW